VSHKPLTFLSLVQSASISRIKGLILLVVVLALMRLKLILQVGTGMKETQTQAKKIQPIALLFLQRCKPLLCIRMLLVGISLPFSLVFISKG